MCVFWGRVEDDAWLGRSLLPAAPRGGLSEWGRVAAPCNNRAKRVLVDLSSRFHVMGGEGTEGVMSQTERESFGHFFGASSSIRACLSIIRNCGVALAHLWMRPEPCMHVRQLAAPHEMGEPMRRHRHPDAKVNMVSFIKSSPRANRIGPCLLFSFFFLLSWFVYSPAHTPPFFSLWIPQGARLQMKTQGRLFFSLGLKIASGVATTGDSTWWCAPLLVVCRKWMGVPEVDNLINA